MRIPALATALAVAIAAPAWAQQPAPAPAPVLRGAALLDALKSGGYTIFFRHAKTHPRETDLPSFDPADCSAQRNLNEAGREQSKRIGAAIAALAIPVDEVLSSPYCRTMDMAILMMGRATKEQAVVGRSTQGGGLPDYKRLQEIVSTPPAPGKNRIIVGHGGPWGDAVGGGKHLEEGEAAILRGTAKDAVVGRLLAEDWEKLPR